MVKDDPFGLSDDLGRTRIRPAAAPRPQAAQVYGGPVVPINRNRAHPNGLLNSFSALLEFAPELESARPPDDPENLRTRLLTELTSSRDAAISNGSALNRADSAAWCVAALLDDLALNTPWGGNSSWPRQPLVFSLYGDVDAGSRFFERLEELERYPNRDPDMLELTYMCLAMGFRGKYRVPGRAGDSSLMAVRAGAARFLRNADAESAPLSPNWKGVVAADEPAGFAVPIWVLALGSAAAMTAAYVLLSMNLSRQSETLFTLARALPPSERAEIFRPIRTTEPTEIIVIEPVTFELLPEFIAAAPGDLLAAMQGREDVSLTILNIQATNPELFRSGSADLTDGFAPLIDSIAATILANAELIGDVTVIGHTDSIPVQASDPFGSNQRLSEERSAKIAELLVAAGVPAENVKSEGRAAEEPVGDNATKAGRAQNRRVEIKIQKRL